MPMRLRRTKIVATLGPATAGEGPLRELVRNGMDVARLNFSHGDASEHVRTAARVRKVAAEEGRTVGVLADLQGSKIRIGAFRSGPVDLAPGARFVIDPGLPLHAGTDKRLWASTIPAWPPTWTRGPSCSWTTASAFLRWPRSGAARCTAPWSTAAS